MQSTSLDNTLPQEPPSEKQMCGSFFVGKDGLEASIRLDLNVQHKNYKQFKKALDDIIDQFEGDGLIVYMSGV
ncbi:MAG: hypothetical protein WC623_22265 [Pedobacter sp.]|uniref:hypothetical protein n=1 Tax=Pedobacter sp. TaxID=1411316 RepID=UPI00356398E9